MQNVLFRQAIIAPAAMLLPIIAGFFADDYNPVSQHMSELELRGDLIAWAVRIGAITAGTSLSLFALGCLRLNAYFSSLTSLLFGIAMISNGVFIIGSPLHGMYGLALFLVLVPGFFLAELPDYSSKAWFRPVSLLFALISLVFMWLLLVGLEPAEIRGLTQRLSVIFFFGWYGIVALLPPPPNTASFRDN